MKLNHIKIKDSEINSESFAETMNCLFNFAKKRYEEEMVPVWSNRKECISGTKELIRSLLIKKKRKIYIQPDMFAMGCEPDAPIHEDEKGTFYYEEEIAIDGLNENEGK